MGLAAYIRNKPFSMLRKTLDRVMLDPGVKSKVLELVAELQSKSENVGKKLKLNLYYKVGFDGRLFNKSQKYNGFIENVVLD